MMLLEALLVCNKTIETAKSAADGNQKCRDYFTSFQKKFNCEEIINGSSLSKEDKEVAKLFYYHDNEYTWETAFSMVYDKSVDLDDEKFRKLVNACKKRIQRTINNYTNEYVVKKIQEK